MKINQFVFVMMALLVMISACSKSDEDEEMKKPLVNHSNKGDMGKQLEGNPLQGYGNALDKGHNVTDTLQQSADQRKAQETQQEQQ